MYLRTGGFNIWRISGVMPALHVSIYLDGHVCQSTNPQLSITDCLKQTSDFGQGQGRAYSVRSSDN